MSSPERTLRRILREVGIAKLGPLQLDAYRPGGSDMPDFGASLPPDALDAPSEDASVTPSVSWGSKVEYGQYTGTPGWAWYQEAQVTVGGRRIGWLETLRRGKQMQKSTHAVNGQFVIGHDVPWLLMMDKASKAGRTITIRVSLESAAERIAESYTEKAPPGWEPTVKRMKSKPGIDNPFALAWWMKGQGFKSRAGKKRKTEATVAPWGPGDLRQTTAKPPRQDDVSSYFDVAPGSYAGDSQVTATAHTTKLAAAPGETDSASGIYYTPRIGTPRPAAPDYLPNQKKKTYVMGKKRIGGRASGKPKADIRWEVESGSFRPVEAVARGILREVC